MAWYLRRRSFRGVARQRLSATAHPAAIRVANELLGRAATEGKAAHAGYARNKVALHVPSREAAPRRDQDLVRQHPPHLALQPADQLHAPRDQARFAQHAEQACFLRRAEAEAVVPEARGPEREMMARRCVVCSFHLAEPVLAISSPNGAGASYPRVQSSQDPKPLDSVVAQRREDSS